MISGSETPRISIIVPVLNEAATIEHALAALTGMEGSFEVVAVDNGSTDGSVALASRWVTTIASPRGRGPAYNAGVARTRGDILLFLHVDTALPPTAFLAIQRAMEDERVVAGCFSVDFDGGGWRPALVGRLYELFARAGYFYGDSAVFVRRSALAAVGGFQPIPIMEDFDLCLRLRRLGPTVRLSERVVTSGRRWQRQGFLKTALVYLTIQGLYLAGVRHPRLFSLYEVVR